MMRLHSHNVSVLKVREGGVIYQPVCLSCCPSYYTAACDRNQYFVSKY